MPIRFTLGLLLASFMPAAAAAQPAGEPVRLRFAVVAGDIPIACGAAYDGVGTTRSKVSIVDFRFYVSGLRFVKADGSETPVHLTQDGLWQLDDVALLDFENGTAGCANGTEQTRDVVEGTLPAGEYTGVRFEVGLPFAKNHREPTLQPSPLNLSRLFWSWNAGYKFIRMDLRTTGQPKGWMPHLGSTACEPATTPTTVPISCAKPNHVTVDLPGLVPARDVVELDLLALLAKSDVDANAPETAMGCMSGPTDPECGPLFEQLGLAWGGRPAGPQKIFQARSAAVTAAGR
jgi:uncharacterized repeat protein (TIGR04052 family)